jgi:hypothetical protein
LDETYPAFGEATGEQAITSVTTRAVHIGAVAGERRGRFFFELEEARDTSLHFESHLVLGNAGIGLRVTVKIELVVIEAGYVVE